MDVARELHITGLLNPLAAIDANEPDLAFPVDGSLWHSFAHLLSRHDRFDLHVEVQSVDHKLPPRRVVGPRIRTAPRVEHVDGYAVGFSQRPRAAFGIGPCAKNGPD